MKNETWAIRFTDREGRILTTEMECPIEPTLEQAAGVVVQRHHGLMDQPEIAEIARDDPMPNLAALAYFNYEIVDIKIVDDPA